MNHCCALSPYLSGRARTCAQAAEYAISRIRSPSGRTLSCALPRRKRPNSKPSRIADQVQARITARKRHQLSHAGVQMLGSWA
jgi:hypothetical protein